VSKAVALKSTSAIAKIEEVLINGDLASLSSDERVSYYKNVCETIGLNPLTKPFDYIKLNGKLTLYARKDATDQLRNIHKVSVQITSRESIEGVYVVTARAKLPDGREDESTGAVTIGGLKGESLANAFMKAETKAKRRVTLSICGLGLLDETEVESIENAEKPSQTVIHPKVEVKEPPTAKAPTRNDLAREILATATQLKLGKAELTKWVQDDFKKPMTQLTDAEMADLLRTLQHELGRDGEIA
jgi:hypothetical protein